MDTLPAKNNESTRGIFLLGGPMMGNLAKILSDGREHCVSVEVFPHSDFEECFFKR